MKKYLLFMIVLALSLSIAGCSNQDNKSSSSSVESSKGNSSSSSNVSSSKSSDDKSSSNGELANDWKSYQIQIDDTVLTLPIKLSDLNKLGYFLQKSDPYLINPKQEAYGTSLKNAAGQTITGSYANLSNEVIDIKDSWMVSVAISQTPYNEDINVVFPGGIKFGDSVEKIKSIYGEPNQTSDDSKYDDSFYQMKYQDGADFHKTLELQFSYSKLTIYRIKIQ